VMRALRVLRNISAFAVVAIVIATHVESYEQSITTVFSSVNDRLLMAEVSRGHFRLHLYRPAATSLETPSDYRFDGGDWLGTLSYSGRSYKNNRYMHFEWQLPLWYVELLGGLLLVTVIGRGLWRRFRRMRRDQCLTCGYSLRGLTSGKCPECGAWIQERQVKRLARTLDQ